MGSLIPPQLSLVCRFQSEITDEFVAKFSRTGGEPEKISELEEYITDEFVAKFSRTGGEPEKISELEEYVGRLQDEMKKTDAFKRDLPLINGLMDEVIVKFQGVISKSKRSNMEPVLEEFIPLKSTITDDNADKFEARKEKDIVTSTDKRNWMSSVQLWSSDNEPDTDLSSNKLASNLENNDIKKSEEIKWPMMDNLFQSGEKKTMGRAFVPFKGSSNFPVTTVGKEQKNELPIIPSLSLSTPEIKISMEDINYNGFSSKPSSSRSGFSSATNSQSQTARKQRRCWSPELHRRFINALQQLGGAQAATPKQIRELMQVDDLTNDEVKSHLQKYRLHTRKANTTTNNSAIQPLGLWVSSQEQCGESSKPSNSQSGSPHGPLHLVGSSRGTSMMTDSMEEEDDEKTESHSWKSHNHLSG